MSETKKESKSKIPKSRLRRSVVKLFTVTKKPNYFQPWDYGYQKTSGGSGCIVEGNRIMTNAHVVSDQVYVEVLKVGDTQRVPAEVEFVSHESEVALLTVDDPSFFEGTEPVVFGEMPTRTDKVTVHGFPIGGNELSITEGVVSRIEVRKYTHSQRELLTIQTDAAINPGNSGGPVFNREGRMVGLAFQSYDNSKVAKSGYVVPIPVIRHFLDDIATGEVSGVPDLGVFWQKLESGALRRYLGMEGDDSGVMVARVVYGSSAHGVLEEQDVIMEIDGADVANDGSIAFGEDDRVRFEHRVNLHQIGESLKLTVLRNRERIELEVPLGPVSRLVSPPKYDTPPTYLIFAGIVFTPLTYNYIRMWKWEDVKTRFRHYYFDGLPNEDRREIVLVNQVLAHKSTAGYHRLHSAVVDRINGVTIRKMRDVLDALESPQNGFHVIELDNHGSQGDKSDYSSAIGTLLVVDADAAEGATREVLERYDIPKDRSPDLAK